MLIGVTGRAEHGKDATGRVLVEEFGFKRYAFADQLKSMALALNPYVHTKYAQRLYTLVQDVGWDEAKKEPEVRRFLQALGTEGVRYHLGEDAWVGALRKKMQDEGDADRQGIAYGAMLVVTDVRFPNEADWIHRMGGELWRVKRLTWEPNIEGYVDYDNGLGRDHPSEEFVDVLPADVEIEAHLLDELQKEVTLHASQRIGGAGDER